MKKGERLNELIRNSSFKNVNQLSKATNVPYTTIKSFIERDLEKASTDSLLKIARVLGVTLDYLVDDNPQTSEFISDYQYPCYPSVSAGLPIGIDGITEQESELITIPDFLMGKYAGDKAIYFTRTNGDSMNKVMPHNTLIAVKSQVELHELKDNDIVVYRNHGEYAVKRFIKTEKELIFRPDSTDGSFRDDVVYIENADDLTISGKVVMWNVLVD